MCGFGLVILDKALEDYNQVLEIDPKNVDALRQIPLVKTDRLLDKGRKWQKLQTAR